MADYDLIIIGGGPAGLGAAIYAGRFKLKTLVLAEELGGTANKAHIVENYAGIKKIKGYELLELFAEQAKEMGAEIITECVSRMTKSKATKDRMNMDNAGPNAFEIITTAGNTYTGKTILLALGSQHKKLGLPEEEKFLGKGVSYCAVCDAAFYKDKTVAVLGGSDAACMGSIILGEYAKKIYLIYRGKDIRAEPMTADKLKQSKKTEIIYNANIIAIKGSGFVESIVLDNGQELKVDGVFVEIGSTPASVLAKDLGVLTDKDGYIIVGQDQKTNIDGVYAAGDITTNSNKFRQIITAAAEGAVAARAVFDRLKK